MNEQVVEVETEDGKAYQEMAAAYCKENRITEYVPSTLLFDAMAYAFAEGLKRGEAKPRG